MASFSSNYQDYTGSNRGKNTAKERAEQRKAAAKAAAKQAAKNSGRAVARGTKNRVADLRNVASPDKPHCLCSCGCNKGINPRKQTHCGSCVRKGHA